jgi:hypothetical protein
MLHQAGLEDQALALMLYVAAGAADPAKNPLVQKLAAYVAQGQARSPIPLLSVTVGGWAGAIQVGMKPIPCMQDTHSDQCMLDLCAGGCICGFMAGDMAMTHSVYEPSNRCLHLPKDTCYKCQLLQWCTF